MPSHPRSLAPVVLAALLSTGAAGCSKQQQPVHAASSADQGAYSLGYVDALSGSRTEVASIVSQMDGVEAEFAKYPDALSDPSWPDVLAVYRAADESGKTAAYVDELERSEVVARFYFEEKDELNRRVGGAVQHAAKEKQCDVDLYGTASYALGKGVEESLRDRLRERSEAHLYLEDHEEALGKKNRPKLEDQIDAIARASYLAHIALPKLRERLARQMEEASAVGKTLGRVAEEEHARAADTKLPLVARKHAQEREQAALAARQRLDPEVGEAKKLREGLEQRAKDVQKKYEKAFEALTDAVEARAKATKK